MGMSKLVTGFRNDHAAVVKLFGEVQNAAAQGQTQKARSTLSGIKDALLGHLQQEEELYQKLAEASSYDKRAAELRYAFSSEMKTIGEAALGFFSKYETAPLDGTFMQEMKDVVGVLGKRIYAEESILYPYYDKLVGADAAPVAAPAAPSHAPAPVSAPPTYSSGGNSAGGLAMAAIVIAAIVGFSALIYYAG